jgi:hypothetical protein
MRVFDSAAKNFGNKTGLAGGFDRRLVFELPFAPKKKEEFTGLMVSMEPGNSFPQICVVSEMIISNLPKSHKST